VEPHPIHDFKNISFHNAIHAIKIVLIVSMACAHLIVRSRWWTTAWESLRDLSASNTWELVFYKIVPSSSNCIVAERCDGIRARSRKIWSADEKPAAPVVIPGLELADELVEPVVENSVANEPPDHSDVPISPPVPSPPPVGDASKKPREKKGNRSWLEECTADNGEQIRYLVTDRPPTKSKIFGGYQVTCKHHDPTTKLNKHGNEYKLHCRRTMNNASADSLAVTLADLDAWAKRGPTYENRVTHQKDRGKLGDANSDADGSDDSAGSNAMLDISGDAHVADEGGDAVFCELCWLAHKEQDCPLIQEHARVLENIKISSRTMQREACNGQLRFETGSYVRRDVLADGDCLFHAFGKEVQEFYKTNLPPKYVCSVTPGPYWRKFLLDYVSTSNDELDNVPIKESISPLVCMGNMNQLWFFCFQRPRTNLSRIYGSDA
jgi:hypothetical protein